jgi:adenine/guanine phosphoribosyltransferase-like PRPP-binding protein
VLDPPDWTKTVTIAVVGIVAAGVLALITGIVWRRIKRRNASKGKQQQHWYGQESA